jgi:hypothetical protein
MKGWKVGLLGAAVAALAPAAFAQGFNGGLPAGWACEGICGTLGANGDVPLSGVTGSTAYGYVSTANSQGDGSALSPFSTGGGLLGGGLGSETNGSRLRSTAFGVAAGDSLDFRFNYITSDGTTNYVEYAWALVRNAGDLSVAALLFTGRTNPNGPPVPGFGLPTTSAVVNGGAPAVQTANAPDWSPLGGSSGSCFQGLAAGCGFTGWITSQYTFASAGSYLLEFGAVNWNDEFFDSGLAFDGITIAGVPIEEVPTVPTVPSIPEPSTYALMIAGLGAVGWMARRRRQDQE